MNDILWTETKRAQAAAVKDLFSDAFVLACWSSVMQENVERNREKLLFRMSGL